jgi:serine protease Do
MSNKKSLLIIFPFFLLFSLMAPSAQSSEKGGIASLRQTSKAFESVARKVSPSVVFIKVESVQKDVQIAPFTAPFGDDLFKRFFGEPLPNLPRQAPSKYQVIGQGSGFVYSVEKGLMSNKSRIITNNHVVKGAKKINVTFTDGSEFDAKVVGTDPKSDIAVLEIKDASHPALPMGDSSQLEVGEWVIAMGNPFGLSNTLTVGVVSAKGRTGLGIEDYEDFIQTDAAINPGNSGGPLLNLDGEVVGMNTAILSRSGGYMGVGFAIPANLVQSIARQLITSGKVTRGYLGIVIQELTPALAESFDVKEHKGILVSQVEEGSPAAKAGLKVGDLIVAYQGHAVDEIGAFRNQVALTSPGVKAELTIIRNGDRKKITVKIGNLEESQVMAQSTGTETAKALGIEVQTITPALAQQFDVKPGRGVVITDVEQGSIAAMAGIRPGMVILEANRRDVNSPAEFKQAVEKSSQDKRILLLISDGGSSRYVVLSWR